MMKPNKQLKILVAEDEPYVSKMYETKFELEGQEVVIAHNGKEALELAKQTNPDIILSDIIMPVMDGLKMLEELRLSGSQIPVIMLTNIGQEDAVTKALALGAKDYIIKADATPDIIYKKVLLTMGQ